jgi:site-specific recombinase XerD
VPKAERLALRKRAYLSELMRAAEVALPGRGRQLKFHDLRHSYAIHLLAIGMTMEDVARSIGDTIEVCEEFYAGFSHTPLSVQTMAGRYIAKYTRIEEPECPK